jgi:hypothetical protein
MLRGVRPFLISFLLLAACTPSEPKGSSPPVIVPENGAPDPVASASPESSQKKPGEAVLFGVVRRFGTKVCSSPRDHEGTWKDEHLRAGFARLEGSARELDALRGQPAILFGSVTKTGKQDVPGEEGDCMPVQRRSDWVSTPDGTVLQRDPPATVASFRVRSAKPFTSLRAEVKGDELAIELENPLEVPFSPVIRVHYEGCYGKAMTHTEGRELGEVASKAKVKVNVPVYVVAGGRQQGHSATSIQVQGDVKDVYFDLDIALAKLGVELSCPKR